MWLFHKFINCMCSLWCALALLCNIKPKGMYCIYFPAAIERQPEKWSSIKEIVSWGLLFRRSDKWMFNTPTTFDIPWACKCPDALNNKSCLLLRHRMDHFFGFPMADTKASRWLQACHFWYHLFGNKLKSWKKEWTQWHFLHFCMVCLTDMK